MSVCVYIVFVYSFVCVCMLCREWQSNQNASNARDLPIGIWIWSSISDTRFPKRVFQIFCFIFRTSVVVVFIDFVTKLLLYFVVNECCFFGVANLITQRLTKIYLYIVKERMFVCVFVCESERERDRLIDGVERQKECPRSGKVQQNMRLESKVSSTQRIRDFGLDIWSYHFTQ